MRQPSVVTEADQLEVDTRISQELQLLDVLAMVLGTEDQCRFHATASRPYLLRSFIKSLSSSGAACNLHEPAVLGGKAGIGRPGCCPAGLWFKSATRDSVWTSPR